MHRAIKDKPTPKTGGVTNRAQATAATSSKPGISKSAFPPTRRGVLCKTNPITAAPDLWRTKNTKRTQSQPRGAPIMRNEPNFRKPSVPPTPISAKRTQFTISPASQRHLFRETNPIPAYQVSRRPLFQRNEPNPSTNTACRAQIAQNEPNPAPRCHPERRAAERNAAAQSRGTCQISIAKGDSKQTNPARTPIMRNEPNSTREPIYELRTTNDLIL